MKAAEKTIKKVKPATKAAPKVKVPKVVKKIEKEPKPEKEVKVVEKVSEEEVVISAQPKGKYIEGVGRRKTAIATVRLYKKGSGSMLVNGKKLNEYFSADKVDIAKQPLKLSGGSRDVDITVMVSGGGENGQAEAVRHGIAKVLLMVDENLRPLFKSRGWVTRDSRKKERKKPGLKRARRAPQWSKR
jgi:small subunit ribosomal protein S9